MATVRVCVCCTFRVQGACSALRSLFGDPKRYPEATQIEGPLSTPLTIQSPKFEGRFVQPRKGNGIQHGRLHYPTPAPTSNPRTLEPLEPLKPSNPQTIKPSNPQTLKPSSTLQAILSLINLTPYTPLYI